MTLNQLVSMLCKLEGKDSQIKVGDMREAVKLLVLLEAACVIKAIETKSKVPTPLMAIHEAVNAKLAKYYQKQANLKAKASGKMLLLKSGAVKKKAKKVKK